MKLKDILCAPSRSRRRTMFGIPGGTSWATLFLYDRLLTHHRQQIKWICEIGTGVGTVTMVLGIWSDTWNIPMMSIDNTPWSKRVGYQKVTIEQTNPEFIPKVKSQLSHSGVKMINRNVFGRKARNRIYSLIQSGPGFLLCDGGDKLKEVAAFAPRAPSGSIIICHDCESEVTHKQLLAIEEVEFYEPWHSESLEMRTTAAVLRRV